MPTSKWLAGVARILCADTGDLKELARIGGADPATLYIGTSLDGVDIRGQDLRGMALPGLDLRRVRRDSDTLLDPGVGQQTLAATESAEAPPPSMERAPTIFLATPHFDKEFFGRGAALGAQVFDLHADADFIYASRGAAPAFIVFRPEDPDLAFSVAKALRALSIDFIAIALERQRSAWGPQDRKVAAELLAPLISVLPAARQVIGEGGSFEIRDLIGILCEDWTIYSDLLGRQKNWYFLRAKGVGSHPNIDACAQLFERMMSGRVFPGPVSLLHYPGRQFDDPNWRSMCYRLLDVEDWFEIERHRRARRHNFDVAVLGSMAPTEQRPPDYFSKVANALEELGWQLELVGDPAPLMRLKGDGEEIIVRAQNRHELGPIGAADDIDLQSFDFRGLQEIVLSENASFDAIVHGLVDRRQLWVSARDLLGLSRDADGFWMIIASQIRRLARSNSSHGKIQYVEILLRAALRREAVDLRDASLWIEALSRSGFGEDWRASISRVSQGSGHASCRLRLDFRNSPRARPLEASLWIDDRGVSLHEVDAVPRPSERQLRFAV